MPIENIAVIKVTPQIKFSNRVSPVNLPSCEHKATGKAAFSISRENKDSGVINMEVEFGDLFFRTAGTAWLPGWGPIRRIGNGSSIFDYRLRELDCEINTLEKCHQRLKEHGRPNIKLTDLYLCTNETGEKRAGACLGDWGSPLFLIKNESYMVQVGIFVARPAYQFHCGDRDDQVVVYMNVSRYVGWIHRRISGCGNHRFLPTVPPTTSGEG